MLKGYNISLRRAREGIGFKVPGGPSKFNFKSLIRFLSPFGKLNPKSTQNLSRVEDRIIPPLNPARGTTRSWNEVPDMADMSSHRLRLQKGGIEVNLRAKNTNRSLFKGNN